MFPGRQSHDLPDEQMHMAADASDGDFGIPSYAQFNPYETSSSDYYDSHMTKKKKSKKRSKDDGDDKDEESDDAADASVVPAASSSSSAPKRIRTAAVAVDALERHDKPDRHEWVSELRREKHFREHIAEPGLAQQFEQLLGPYRRPALPSASAAQYIASQQPVPNSLSMYLLEPDYTTLYHTLQPQIRLFGSTIEGHSVTVLVNGFEPCFYVRINATLRQRIAAVVAEGSTQDSALEAFRAWLNERAGARDPSPPASWSAAAATARGKYIMSVHMQSNRSLFGYEKDTVGFLRIVTFQPRHVPLARDVLFGKAPRSKSRFGGGGDDDGGGDGEDDEEVIEKTYRDSKQSQLDSRYGLFEVFEADIAYVLNFLVSKNIKGCGWLRISNINCARDVYDPASTRDPSLSRTQIELHCNVSQIEALSDKNDVPPLRTLSIDIECAGKEGRFPLPGEDPIICLTAIVHRLQDGARPLVAVGMAVGEVAETTRPYIKLQFGAKQPVVDPKTGAWNRAAEIDMLLAFRAFIVDIADPDFLSGYNSDNFDYPYIMKRADALGIGAAMRRLGRMRDELSSLSMSTFSSKAFGTRTDLRMRCSGRIPWDVMRILRREVKSRSYSLNAQALEWTGKKKHELSHDQIGPSWIGPRATPITRRRVLDYNENDARLSYEINAKKLFIWLYQELARATGVSLETILNRGQGIKTLSQVLREAHANQFLVRTFRDYKQKCMLTGFPEKLQQQQQQQQGGGDKKTKSAKKKTNADDEELLLFGDDGEAQDAAAAYQGATVIDPILGYYQVPITTLDFSSLYPSIDIAWNLCWTTYTTAPECAQKGWKERPKDAATGRYIAVTVDGKYRPEIDGDYIVTPVGHYFVTKRVREGILPRILVGLLKRRSEAKVVLGAVKNAKKQLFVLREKLATATTTMPDAIEALRKEVVTAIDKLDGVVKKIEPTALPMFDPLRTAFNALVPPLSATSIAVLNTLCDQYESLELTYDARQNALKICANSGYGFTGAHVGPQPLKAIAASITAFGRVAIETKRTAIEREFPMDDTVTQNGRMRPIVIGGDTDSIFIIFPNCDTPAKAVEWGKRAADWINDKFFEKPMATVWEKLYFPAVYIAPKRYGGRKYTKPNQPDQVPKPGGKDGELQDLIDVKGVESVRRDSSLMVSEAVATVLRKLLSERNPLSAASYVANLVDDLRTGRADLNKLIISKSLSKLPEQYPAPAAHVELAKRLKLRSPATAPRVGDRVPYILVARPPDKTAGLSTGGEDPAYVLEQGLSIDVHEYVEMLRKPMQRMLDPVLPGVVDFIFDRTPMRSTRAISITSAVAGGSGEHHQHEFVQDLSDRRVKEQAKKKKVREQSDYAPSNETLKWVREKSRVQVPDVERTIAEMLQKKHHCATSAAFSVPKFVSTSVPPNSPFVRLNIVKVLPKCAACGSTTLECIVCGPSRSRCDCEKPVKAALCNACQVAEASKHRQRSIEVLAEATKRNEECWGVCRECVGSIEDAEGCAFKECSNWFARMTVRRDLERAKEKAARFGDAK